VKARELLSDGTYQRVKPSEGMPALRSKQQFMELSSDAGSRPVAATADPPPIPVTRVAKRSQRDKPRRTP
jgi:hypothetical protein